MKTTKYLSLAALALMGTLASCQSDDELTIARPDNAVGINVSVGSLQATRSNPAATDDTQREFNQGDQISVSTNDQEAVIFQCTSTENQTWTEATAGKFLLWTQPMLTFSAYYPATTGTSMTAFTVPTDQSSVDKIALADYMTRQQNISRPEGGSDIQMQLERKMARVIVRISGFGSQYRDEQKTVSNVRIYSETSGIENDNPTGSSTEILPYAQGNGGLNTTYTALVVPGYGDSGARFIQLTDGESSTLEVKGIPELNAGNSYTFNLVVGKNKILVQSVTVTDWTTGATLAGGQATEKLTPTLSLTSPAVGQVIGSDGKNYAYGSLPTGVTAVAKICYVSGSNGLALALTDEGKMEWSTAIETCAAHTAPFTGGTWKLATTDEWDNMINAAGSYSALRDGFISVGGTNMQSDGYYWSSTEDGSIFALYYDYQDLDDWDSGDKEYELYVRACLAFTVEQGSAAEGHALSASAVGEIVGTDGKAYAVADKDNLPSNVTAAGMVAYKSETAGQSLVIALTDEASTMIWSTANGETGAAAHTPVISGYSWKLPSKDEWKQMFSANGGDQANCTGLNTAINTAGGTALLVEGGIYWTCTVTNHASSHYIAYLNGNVQFFEDDDNNRNSIRACIAF